MPTSLPARTYQTGGAVSWIGRGLLSLGVISVVALCVLLNGSQIRAAAEAEEARLVEEENRAFCSKFGIGPETSRHAECAAGLMEIRARHLRRSVSDFIF